MRFTSVCTTAAMLPTSSDSTASPKTAGRQSTSYSRNAPTKMRSTRRERGGLRGRGHERGDRRRRALVDVGRPHVERRGRDLEAEPDQEQRETDEQHAVVEQHDLREELRDPGEVRRAGRAVDERDAVEEHRRRERAEQEVLEAGLLRREPAAVERGEHVQRDRQDLERQEDGDEVVGRRHQHHAGGRAQHQRDSTRDSRGARGAGSRSDSNSASSVAPRITDLHEHGEAVDRRREPRSRTPGTGRCRARSPTARR